MAKTAAAEKESKIEQAKSAAAEAKAEVEKSSDKLSKEELKAIEERMFERVCRAAGLDPDQIKEDEKNRERSDEVLEYDLGKSVVHINGLPYTGRGKGSRGLVEGLMHAAGAKKMRLLREKIGNEYQIEELAGGGFGSRLVGSTDEES